MGEHICLVSDTIYSFFNSEKERGTGGAERQQYILSNRLKSLGFDISIATLSPNSPNEYSYNGINIWNVIPETRGVAKAPYKAFRTINGLRKIDADVYYVRGNDFLCMVTAVYTQMDKKSFVYAVANDSDVEPQHIKEKGILRRPFVKAMKSADAVIAQTAHQKQVLLEEHGIEAIQIPNGYDVPPQSQILDHEEREYILWVGSMDPDQKKPKRFLKLAQKLPNISFRMIGPPDNDDPTYYDEIKNEAEKIPNLEFLGYVDPDEIHDHYKFAIALVNTSDYEGFPNVFLESWRYATPVISLHHTLDGVLNSEPVGIHAGTMENLIESVEEISEDGELRRQLGTGGRDYMEANYSLEHLIDEYIRVFESLAEGNN